MKTKIILKKKLQKGRFYLHSDRHGGHPALLYKKRDKKNIYFIIIFSSKPGRKRKQLKHSTEPTKVKNSYVHINPDVVKRREQSSKQLEGISINKEDKPTIEVIKRKK